MYCSKNSRWDALVIVLASMRIGINKEKIIVYTLGTHTCISTFTYIYVCVSVYMLLHRNICTLKDMSQCMEKDLHGNI